MANKYEELTPLELWALKQDYDRNYDKMVQDLETDKEMALDEIINGRGSEKTEARADYNYAKQQLDMLPSERAELEDAYYNSLKM